MRIAVARSGKLAWGRFCSVTALTLLLAALASLARTGQRQESADTPSAAQRSSYGIFPTKYRAERSKAGEGFSVAKLLGLEQELHAQSSSMQTLMDRDSDLLPDSLEWVLFSNPGQADSDADGTDDFIEAIQYSSPIEKNLLRPITNGFRLLLDTSFNGPNKQRQLGIHLLFRLAGGKITDLEGLTLFLDKNGRRMSLDPLLLYAISEWRIKRSKSQGLLLRISLKIPMPAVLETMAPITIGAICKIGGGVITAGAPLFNLSGAYYGFSVLGRGLVALQSTGANEITSPFWNKNKACVLELEILGLAPGWKFSEVQKADCEVAFRGQCVSADCNSNILGGAMVLIPDALPLVEGG